MESPKRFEPGDIVYYIHYGKYGSVVVYYGTIEEQFQNCVTVNMLQPRETRTVEGVRFDLWKPDHKERKLPKGWTYDTILIEYGKTEDREKIHKALMKTHASDKDAIRKLIDKGYIVKRNTSYYANLSTFIGKGVWYPIKEFKPYDPMPSTVSLWINEVYDTYDEALKEAESYKAERYRIASLSDEEYALELIDRDIDRWAELYSIPSEKSEKCRQLLHGMDDVKDVETRIFNNCLQWKYTSKKRWNDI